MKTKLAFLWFYDCYNAVMDHNKNPLRNIPDPVSRMWIMTVLAFYDAEKRHDSWLLQLRAAQQG